MSTAAQLPRSGDMIAGKYVLDRLLGQGGMGAVFAARHLKLSKAVAIKIMLADSSNPEASQRFINEGRAAANIQNEHVVRVDDVDEEMGYAYMVLELLEGEDLAQLLEREPAKRLMPHLVVGYVIQALRGVTQAHALGIVHRDLKPSNLFLAKRKDGSSVVKVLDFGISKATGAGALGQAPSALTSTKAMLGSPLYMSPEQLRNAKSVDHRADIWAMGIILYELMTGALPFMGENLGELFAAILESDPLTLSARVPGIPAGLDEVVLRCLARKPEGRYQSVAELAHALAPYERQLPGMAGGMAGIQKNGAAFIPQAAITPNGVPQSSQGRVAPMPGQATGPYLPHGGSMSGGQISPHAPPSALIGGQGGNVAMGPHAPPMPPGFNQTTGSGWQAGAAAPSKSKAPLFVGIAFGVFALIGILGIVAFVKMRPPAEDTHAKNPPPPTSSVVATSEPRASAVPTTAVSAPSVNVATAEPPASATPTVATVATHTNPPPVPVPPKPGNSVTTPPVPPPTHPAGPSSKTPQLDNSR